jgi:hypothetical protein
LPCPMLVVLAGKADPLPHGEAMRAVVDTAATRLQQPIRRSSWHGCRVVTPSRWSAHRSWPNPLSGSLKPRQLSCELPSWRGPALKAGPDREIHLILVGLTE